MFNNPATVPSLMILVSLGIMVMAAFLDVLSISLEENS